MQKRWTVFLFSLLVSVSLSAQYQWELAKQKNGITVYTSQKEGSALLATKVTATLTAGFPTVAAVFQDVDQFDQLFAGTKSARLLKRQGETYQIHYLRSEAPWPVADRDGIFTYRFSYDRQKGAMVINQQTLPTYLPEESGVVRIPECQGTWTFKTLGNGQLEATYIFYADPGGSLPAWVVNIGSVDMPFESMSNLIQQVKQPKYQGQHFQFLE